MNKTTTYDVIIIGAGAAGLSAGLVLSRARADVLIVDSGQPRNAPATQMHGFLSRDGVDPAGFLRTARHETEGYGGEFLAASVASVDTHAGSFRVTLVDATTVRARAILVATGLVDQLPLIPGLRDRWGSLVHHCPYCHGYEVRGLRISVIGGPAREMSIKQAGLLRRYSDAVTFITNGIDLGPSELSRLEAFDIHVVTANASHLVGASATLTGVALGSGDVVPTDAVFIAPPQRPQDELLRGLGCETDAGTGLVRTDPFGATNVPGVWAAGNVVTPSAQIITAAGAGSAAAISINGWLLNNDLDAATAARQ
ncbi:NAD(P)/FAD-dependent oxidoreductase [Salinibacterium sp. G-O1]|uniref:NAD(P)/FAD-dependent oxidoreductase n=1 Tax=Salinibacterium sp. G-O1 TaxID=3046208 RepID=UPI0024B9C849|nr:NAD(P)/FAD-dependent oxidoreductase [Salinibacterium sp. G-O1]MDJ0333970.1 NAD(P)/FAD-dependent oxidoreductase [Salinibacterium sp. G-O1]